METIEIDSASIIDVGDIDCIEDKEPAWFTGKFLRWHNEELYPFVVINNGLFAKMIPECEYCPSKGEAIYLASGLHSGAWCYAHNESHLPRGKPRGLKELRILRRSD